MDKQLNEQMSFEIITQAIENAKINLKDNGFFYLLNGWLVLSASLLQYGLLKFSNTNYHWIGWPILMTIGGIISMIYGYRLGKKTTVVTHVDKAMIYLWYGFLAAILIFIVMAILGQYSFQILNPTIMVLFGLGTFVSGGILKFKPLLIGGIASWIIAILAFLNQSADQLLLMALAITIAYLIPGYMLKNKKNHV